MHPVTAPRLVGRDREMAAVTAALLRAAGDESASALITIVGPVGVGKSALARHAAMRLAQSGIVDGMVWLNPASPSLRTTSLAPASARSDGTPLVVLDGWDGCDAVEVHDLLRRVLADAPGATLLATARSALRAAGETVIELAPLGRARGRALQDGAAPMQAMEERARVHQREAWGGERDGERQPVELAQKRGERAAVLREEPAGRALG